MAQFPFVGGSYTARSKNFDAQRCINLFPVLSDTGSSKSIAALYGTPGLALWLSLAGGGIRGMLRFNANLAVVVCGGNVYIVTAAGVSTLIGGVDNTLNPVGMASNGIQVVIVTGQFGYIVNPINGTMSQILNPAFSGADAVWFLDGYFVFNKPGTGQFQTTQLYSTDIDALDFATAEGAPDLLLTLLVDHRELWLFGETSTEVFFNSGNTDFPFERINGAFIEQGCAAKHSPAKVDNSVYWLAADERGVGTVQRALGYQPQKVSDQALEYALAKMPRIDDAVAYTYQQEGHSFYVLNFPTAEQTWVFDTVTNMWHQRAWRDPVTAELKRHRAQCQMTFNGKVVVGDWENGNLYYLDLDTFTDNGDLLPRIRSCPHLADPGYKWQIFHSLQVDMQTGVGLSGVSGASGVDPKAMLRWSNDGGYTWSNEVWASIGKIGERTARVKWRKLGRSRDRVFEVTIADPVRVVIVGASVEATVGAS